MRNLIRKWILHYKRKRYHQHLRESGNYKTLENSVRETGSLCSNCNAPLTGPFCHICGQKDDDLQRPIWTLLREILDDVFSTDSRLFKTLFLLVLVPGGLTRAFRMGRRARFVPPLRLYLVVSILFFLIISVGDILILDINVKPIDPPTPPAVPEQSTEAEKAEAPAPPEVPQVGPDGQLSLGGEPESSDQTPGGEGVADEEGDENAKLRAEAERKLQQTSQRLKEILGDDFKGLSPEAQKAILDAEMGRTVSREEIEKAIEEAEDVKDTIKFELGFPYDVDVSMFVRNTGEERQGLKQEDIDRVLNAPDVPEFFKEATRGFAKALKEPEAFNELFNDWLPRALFVLMPVFAMILRLFHWGEDRVYLQQLVFSLHFHTFLFLLMTAMMVIIPAFGGDMGIAIFWWGTSIYLIIALKVGQGQGWIRAFLKAGFIWVSYSTVMALVLFGVVFTGLRDL